MKHLLHLALCATAVALVPTSSFAGTFGLFYCRGHCDKCAFCVRPYNAFTPVVCGNAEFGMYSTGHMPYFRTGTCGRGGCGLIGGFKHRHDLDGPGAFGDNCGGCVPFIGVPTWGNKRCETEAAPAVTQPVSYPPPFGYPAWMAPAPGYPLGN